MKTHIFIRLSVMNLQCARDGDDTLFALLGCARPAGKMDLIGNTIHVTFISRVWIHSLRELEMARFSLCAAALGQPQKIADTR